MKRLFNWVKNSNLAFVCQGKKPNTHPVTKAKRAEGFNQQVCLDTFDVPIYNGKTIKMLNMICEGLVPLWKGAKAKDFRRAYAYRKYWIRWGWRAGQSVD